MGTAKTADGRSQRVNPAALASESCSSARSGCAQCRDLHGTECRGYSQMDSSDRTFVYTLDGRCGYTDQFRVDGESLLGSLSAATKF